MRQLRIARSTLANCIELSANAGWLKTFFYIVPRGRLKGEFLISRIGTNGYGRLFFFRFFFISHAFIFLAACGHGKSENEVSLSVASIPDANCHIYTEGGLPNGEGSHQFINGPLTQAQAWDCGIRDGKRCFYFIHYSDSTYPIEYHDTICQ
jgi:hypothetical protein